MLQQSNITTKTDDTQSSTRRRFLATAGTVVCVSGLSGCSAWSWPWAQSTITEVTTTTDSLVVTLAAESNATVLTLVRLSGQTIWETQLGAGETRTTIPLLYPKNGMAMPIPPGTYTVVAGKDCEELDNQEVTLTQSMTLDDLGVYTTSVQNDYGPDVNAPTDITVTITNTGTLPLRITYLGLISGVPDPSQYPPRRGTFDGAFVRDQQLPPARQGLVRPTQTVTVHTVTQPLMFYEDPNDPAPTKWQGESGHCQGTTHKGTLVIAGVNNL
jgi:hypothetical protein